MGKQRLSFGTLGGSYVNETSAKQRNALGSYVNETSATTPPVTGSVAETLTPADVESAAWSGTGAVAETLALVDTFAASGSSGVTIAEAGSLVDVVFSAEGSHDSIMEVLSASDVVAIVGSFGATVEEVVALVDILPPPTIPAFASVEETLSPADDTTALRGRRDKWFLSFVDVVPPPAGEGEGNPGKLFGDYELDWT